MVQENDLGKDCWSKKFSAYRVKVLWLTLALYEKSCIWVELMSCSLGILIICSSWCYRTAVPKCCVATADFECPDETWFMKEKPNRRLWQGKTLCSMAGFVSRVSSHSSTFVSYSDLLACRQSIFGLYKEQESSWLLSKCCAMLVGIGNRRNRWCPCGWAPVFKSPSRGDM